MLRLLKWLFAALVFVIGLWFAFLNNHPVEVNYVIDTRTVSLSIVLAILFALGFVFGVIASLIAILPLSRENRRLRKQVRVAEQEVSNLRSIPLKDAL
jgi:putative membrane protein